MLFNLFFLLNIGCDSVVETLPCSLGDVADVFFGSTEKLCVQIEMNNRDFKKLGQQFRFGNSPDDQFSGVVRHILTSCTEPYPDPYTYFSADVQVGGLAGEQVGIRKNGFVGSVLKGSEERPSLKIKTNKFIDDQYLRFFITTSG